MAFPATHCKYGHEFTPENTRWIKPSNRRTPYKRCKLCERVGAKGEKRAAYLRDYRLQRVYGMTRLERSRLLVEQDGLCAICYEEPAVVIDHDHETGVVRGMLCHGCNVGLGLLGDGEEGIRRVLEYLTTPRIEEVG